MSTNEFFADYAEVLDKTIANLHEISTKLKIFVDECTIKGYVPPHPFDLLRSFEKPVPPNYEAIHNKLIKKEKKAAASNNAAATPTIISEPEKKGEITPEIYQQLKERGQKYSYPLQTYHYDQIIAMNGNTVTRKQLREEYKKMIELGIIVPKIDPAKQI